MSSFSALSSCHCSSYIGISVAAVGALTLALPLLFDTKKAMMYHGQIIPVNCKLPVAYLAESKQKLKTSSFQLVSEK